VPCHRGDDARGRGIDDAADRLVEQGEVATHPRQVASRNRPGYNDDPCVGAPGQPHHHQILVVREPQALDIQSGDPAHLTAFGQRCSLDGQRALLQVGTGQRHLTDELAVGGLDVAEHLEVVPDRESFPERGDDISI
jgi:hypothetical protein